MKNILFCSDLHFGHDRIRGYSNRPFSSVEEMNEALINNWNARVKPEDDVWHLGDFAFMKLNEFKNVLRRLNGSIHCILGNHDKLLEENRTELLNMGKIKSIQHYAELNYNGQIFVLFHYGMRIWNRSHKSSIHLYGHSHGSLPPFGKSVDVGVDCKEITDEYRPIHADEIIKYMSKRQGEVIDHHGKKDDAKV